MLGHNTLVTINTPRKQKYTPGGRQHVHKVKATAQEEELLKDRASKSGVTISRFLLDTALGKSSYMIRKVVATELLGIRRELQGLATNANQVARLANVDHQTPYIEDFVLAIDGLDPLMAKIWKVVRELET